MAVYCGNDRKRIKYTVWTNAEILIIVQAEHVFTNAPWKFKLQLYSYFLQSEREWGVWLAQG
jgi:hypothetical protein